MMDCSAKTVGIHIMHNFPQKKKKKKTKGMEKPWAIMKYAQESRM